MSLIAKPIVPMIWQDGRLCLLLPSPPLKQMEGHSLLYFGQGELAVLKSDEVAKASRAACPIAGTQLEMELRCGLGRPGGLLAELTSLPLCPPMGSCNKP
jgi:hypothetical protein